MIINSCALGSIPWWLERTISIPIKVKLLHFHVAIPYFLSAVYLKTPQVTCLLLMEVAPSNNTLIWQYSSLLATQTYNLPF